MEAQPDSTLQTLYENDRVRITFEPGSSGCAVVSFSGAGLGLGGVQTAEFRRTLNGMHDAYYVMDLNRQWYNGIVTEIVNSLSLHLKERAHRDVLCLGNSMGGTGALIFAGLLPNCAGAVAFCAHSSVHQDYAPFESRYWGYRKNIQEWTAPDVLPFLRANRRYYLLYGDQDACDMGHASRFRTSNVQSMHIYSIKGAGHEIAKDLRRRGISLARLISSAWHGGAEKLEESLELAAYTRLR